MPSNPPAIKFQQYRTDAGKPPSVDQRGAEPAYEHNTVRLPGVYHGMEIDPAPPEAVALLEQSGELLNHEIYDFFSNVPGVPKGFGVGFFLMDGDGKV